MTDIVDRYTRVADDFASTIAAVSADGWSAPSPCEGWTALDVVAHVVESHDLFEGFVNRTIGEVSDPRQDPGAAFAGARAAVIAHLDDPVAAGATFDGFFGQTSFADAIDRFISADLVIHRWDLARATGQDETIRPDEVARGRVGAEEFGDALRGPNAFGPEMEVAEDADDQAKLLAFLGRRP